ncbi:hypothetical protein L9F63_014774, partial [Diploptera punctata]
FEVGEVLAIIFASVVLTLLIDLPFQELRKCLWNEGKCLQLLSNPFSNRL